MTAKTGNAVKVRPVKVVPQQGPDNRQQRVADQLIQHIDTQIQTFLNGWQTQALGALMAAQQPPEDGSKVFWYIALGGNLLWAGTCLINPASAGITIMSFSGAAIGSGSIEQLWKNPPEEPADAKALASGWVSQKRDALEATFKKARREWATDLAGLDGFGGTAEQTLDMINAYIWTHMFPRIAHDDRKYSTIHTLCLKNIEAMLADFRTQWQKYVQRASWFGMAERKRRNIYFQYVPTVQFDLATGTLKNVPAGSPKELLFY
jgi:hypothetical protein